MGETIWGTMRPGDRWLTEEQVDGSVAVLGPVGLSGVDWFVVPDGLPGAGQRVRVSETFWSFDPKDPASGRLVPHAVSEDAGIGVAQSGPEFAIYKLPLPRSWPKMHTRTVEPK